MGKALNILVGSVATAMVTVGIAAQTGTVRWPAFDEPSGAGGVQAQQAMSSPATGPSPSPSAAPTPAPPPPPPPVAPPAHKKHGH